VSLALPAKLGKLRPAGHTSKCFVYAESACYAKITSYVIMWQPASLDGITGLEND